MRAKFNTIRDFPVAKHANWMILIHFVVLTDHTQYHQNIIRYHQNIIQYHQILPNIVEYHQNIIKYHDRRDPDPILIGIPLPGPRQSGRVISNKKRESTSDFCVLQHHSRFSCCKTRELDGFWSILSF